MSLIRLTVIVFVCTCLVSEGLAGLVMESVSREGEGPEITSRMAMDSNGLRTDSPEGTFIFRPDKQLLWMLDIQKKEYHQITESDLMKMTSKLDATRREMKEQLERLPADQRVMVEEMIKKQLSEGAPMEDFAGGSISGPRPVFEKVAEDEKVGSWNCDKYVEMENGIKVGEVWTVPALTFLSYSRYFKMLIKLGDFFGKMPLVQGKAFEIPLLKVSEGEEEGGLSGIPVKEIRYKPDGSMGSRWELRKISEESVDGLVFELPKDYKQRPLMENH